MDFVANHALIPPPWDLAELCNIKPLEDKKKRIIPQEKSKPYLKAPILAKRKLFLNTYTGK